MNRLNVKIGNMLRHHREQAKLSMDDVSQKIMLSKYAIHSLEHGTSSPRFGAVIAYAHFLGHEALADLVQIVKKPFDRGHFS